MSHSSTGVRFAAVFAALVLIMALAASAAQAAGPSLSIASSHAQTNLPPGGTGALYLGIANVGDEPTSGPITVAVDSLPAGVTATSINDLRSSWSCDLPTLTCTRSGYSFMPTEWTRFKLDLAVSPAASGSGTATASVSGGSSTPASDSTAEPIRIDATPTSFGVTSFTGEVRANSQGQPATLAGAHPYDASTTIQFDTRLNDDDKVIPGGNAARDIVVDLPPGFVGNPTAVAQCSEEELFVSDDAGLPLCPVASQVGEVGLYVDGEAGGTTSPVYNMIPPRGVAGMFGFTYLGTVVHLIASVRSGGDYGLTVTAPTISQGLPLSGTTLTFWGTPAAASHDSARAVCKGRNLSHLYPTLELCSAGTAEVPFLTNPSDCDAGLLTTTLNSDSWDNPGVFEGRSFDHDVNGVPFEVEDCDAVPFEPTFTAQPTTNQAASPTGLDVHLSVPQQGLVDPEAIASAHLKKAEVTLPAGMLINPSSADGLGACSPEQIGLITPPGQSPAHFTPGPANCADNAKIGAVEIDTPLLDHLIKGSVYLASQGTNPFKSTLALYLAVADPQTGVVVKLPGKVSPDPSTGQLTAVFDNNPQLPFSDLHLQFKEGPRAPLMTPATCGTYSTQSTLTSWSGGPAVQSGNSFKITNGPSGSPCPNNEFAPKFSAGTQSPLGGTYSPFVLRFSRADGTQEVGGLASATLPPGLTGKLAGIPYCSDAALGGISTASGSGAAQVASPACPAASQIGIVTAGAGAGPTPFYVKTGKAYLAGPYQGAPLSMAIVTPAVAGPFDLGNVVVRSALNINPETTQVSAGAVTLPRFLEGIPLDLRSVEVTLDRPNFTINPTNCDPMAIDATLTGVDGATANVSSRFQAGGCVNLGFKPKLALRFFGPTHRTAHPRLKATLTMPPGQANIGKTVVTLPKTEFLENAHIQTICTRVQYAAKACPARSIYGYATAWSPLLDQPLAGPVYLRSSNHELPDLVASLDGQVHIDLVGRIDAVNARIRNSFEAVPDAPVSKFVLEMKGGKKGLLVNNTELCKTKPRATVLFDGQNGKLHDTHPVVQTDCRKKGKKSGKGKKKSGNGQKKAKGKK